MKDIPKERVEEISEELPWKFLNDLQAYPYEKTPGGTFETGETLEFMIEGFIDELVEDFLGYFLNSLKRNHWKQFWAFILKHSRTSGKILWLTTENYSGKFLKKQNSLRNLRNKFQNKY